ncbi:VWA domain-containing protein [Nocardioides marmoribigeumensis]|uniref:Mg-chelatase subunit ChlD n=1 Tax=Nocardioides marmoribigeumensis TaxID=433649 RepID=A0ABU2BPQ0_9ACTN|nr:VWA domain-containing protein [Nocardioides marmoribigeumensis]MDR7360617.1 Mg-chelatase subunit ChlD [Nocardioides marmoribigeumensis]
MPSTHPTTPARHRKPRRRGVVVGASALAVGTVATGAVLVGGASPSQGTAACPGTTVRVAAAPEIAPVVAHVADGLAGTCRTYVVRTTLERPTGADVWVAESSVRTSGTSVASSPVVLAVPALQGRGLGPEPTYDRLPAGLRFTATDVEGDPVTQAGLVDLTAALQGGPSQRGVLTGLLRSVSSRAGGAVLTTEVAAPASSTVVRPASGGTVMDYPFVTLRSSKAAGALLAALSGSAGRDALAQAGFGPPTDTRVLTEAAAARVRQTLQVLQRPTRTLALIDVSGSMAAPVPGAHGATRIDLAREAIRAGLGLLPDGTVAGLWRFSDNLTPSTDYEEVAPLTELTDRTRGLLGPAVDRLRVDPDGGTGLYSSTLAAVRAVRASYDDSRVNSVIVLSDGRDRDAEAHHIPLRTLLHALTSEADPARPVRVIGIAYGPDSDTAAMRAVTDATGGTLYTARDPRDLPVIFREAIGSRLCSGAAC